MSLALLGMLVELAQYAPVFAEAGERPEDAIDRVRPAFVVLVDDLLEAARSDLFFARAARRRIGVAIFGRQGAGRELAAHARSRGIPAFELPTDAERLARVIEAAAAAMWWRRGADRRARRTRPPDDRFQLVFTDRRGRRWLAFDRRGADRRQERELDAGAPGPGTTRLFVSEDGEARCCELRADEVNERSQDDLERQLARATDVATA